jgi:hypothetical protein
LHKSSPLPQFAAVVTNEMQEQLLAREEELSLYEEGLVMREAVIEASERAIGVARMALNTEQS